MATGIGGEIAWWCPSLDDAGNGTTTSTDLIGSNNGALTDMDAATDWVADTDQGGVRALDYDGANDHVLVMNAYSEFASGVWAISTWVNWHTAVDAAWGIGDSTTSGRYMYCISNAGTIQLNVVGAAEGTAVLRAGSIGTSTWCHVLVAMTASGVRVFVDGVERSITVVSGTNNQKTWSSGQINRVAMGALVRTNVVANIDGRIDDTRLFDAMPSTANITALASQRGYQPTSPNQQRRQTQQIIQGAF